MNGTNIVFDTCAAIFLLRGKYELSSLGINIDEVIQYISVITRIELMSKPDMKAEEERAIKNFVDDVIVSLLDEAIERKTVEIRRSTKLKLPDCIIAATSIVLDAILLTGDDNLLKLSWPGFRARNIL